LVGQAFARIPPGKEEPGWTSSCADWYVSVRTVLRWVGAHCLIRAGRPARRAPCSAMEWVMDFLLDSARNSLCSPSRLSQAPLEPAPAAKAAEPGPWSTGNGLAPALRVNTHPTASADGWRTLRAAFPTRTADASSSSGAAPCPWGWLQGPAGTAACWISLIAPFWGAR